MNMVFYHTGKVIRALSHVRRREFSSETIFSLSSGRGKCGVAVIRVSGSNSLSALKCMVSDHFEPKARYASLRRFRHPKTKEEIDRGLVLWFPGPNSFTGEDSCEFQIHGGLAVVRAMLDALGSIPNLRLARPGEFTKRAFFNGKLDLTEVEGLADMIHAETEAQRRQALLQSTGALSKIYKNWREKLIRSIAYLEALIDFAEDENIGEDALEVVKLNVRQTVDEIRNHLDDKRQGEILRDGVQTAIIGAPNVGKSSFLNLICQRNISIVTPIAGTTRDVIESFYNIGGYPVVFADTAGLRTHTDDVIEKEGIHRSIDRIKSADLIVFMVDAANLVSHLKFKQGRNMNSYMEEHMKILGLDFHLTKGRSTIIIANKIDLVDEDSRCVLRSCNGIIPLSCSTSENLDELMKTFTHILEGICGNPMAESPRLSKLRYRHLLNNCIVELECFLAFFVDEQFVDLAIAAQKLRTAVRHIEQIVGNVTTEQILDIIFQDFCIGK